jgi:hypothetical protein
MKNILTISLMCLVFSLKAQVVQLAQAIDFTNSNPKDSFGITITNTDTVPHSFYPLTVFDLPGSYKFVSQDHYYDYLRAEGTQLGALKANAKIMKSNRFVNNWLEAGDYGPEGFNQKLANKQYSPIGFILGASQYQCGSFARASNVSLVESGIFSKDSIWDVSLNGHQTSEVIMDGDLAHYDPDPGQGFLLDTLPDGTFMSQQDIYDSSQYLNPYTYCDPVTNGCYVLHPEKTKQKYRDFFNYCVTHCRSEAIKDIQPVITSGLFKMCADSYLTWELKFPTYVMDSATPEGRTMMDSARSLVNNGKRDSLPGVFATSLNVSIAEAMRMMKEKDFILSDGGKFGDVVTDIFYQKEIEIKYHISARNKPVYLGTDVSFPFSIRSVTTNNPIQIGDTVFPAGTSTIARYNQKNDHDEFSNDTTTPYITDRQFQWLGTSGVIPPNTTVDFVLFYNQLIYAFPNGIRAETFGDSMKGIVTSQYPSLATGISVIASDEYWRNEPKEYFTIALQKVTTPLVDGVYLEKQGSHYKKIVVLR